MSLKFQPSNRISTGVITGQIPPPLPNCDIAPYVCHDFEFLLLKFQPSIRISTGVMRAQIPTVTL